MRSPVLAASALCLWTGLSAQSRPSVEHAFLTGELVIGAQVRDSAAENGATVGTIQDLGIETESGRVVFAVIRRNGVIGTGAKSRVLRLPGAFCNPPAQRGDSGCVFALGAAELENAPAFEEQLVDEFYHRWNAAEFGDAAQKAPPAARLDGTITALRETGDVVIAELRVGDESPRTVEVALGPASYLKANGWSFATGQRCEVTTAGGAASKIQLATSVKPDGATTLALRDRAGLAQWRQPKCVLATRLTGAPVHANGTKLGSIAGTLFVLPGWNLAFASVTTANGTLLVPFPALRWEPELLARLKIDAGRVADAPKLANDALIDVRDAKFRERVSAFYAGAAASSRPVEAAAGRQR